MKGIKLIEKLTFLLGIPVNWTVCPANSTIAYVWNCYFLFVRLKFLVTSDPTNSEIHVSAWLTCVLNRVPSHLPPIPVFVLSRWYPYLYTQILIQCGNGALLFKDFLVSSHCFEPRSFSVTPYAILSCAGWYHLCRPREPAGSPSTLFPLGLRVRGLLPLSCRTLLGMLSVLQGTDVRAYLQSGPAVCPSYSTGRLVKPSQAPCPPFALDGADSETTQEEPIGMQPPCGPDSHWGGETSIEWNSEQLLEWATLSIPPLSCVMVGQTQPCTQQH